MQSVLNLNGAKKLPGFHRLADHEKFQRNVGATIEIKGVLAGFFRVPKAMTLLFSSRSNGPFPPLEKRNKWGARSSFLRPCEHRARIQNMSDKIEKTDAEWKQLLTPEQYHILREKGTERAGTGEYADNHDKGIYKCAACEKELFGSGAKFESGSGWPSFYAPVSPDAVATETDRKFFMKRTEVLCARCGGHLGHVFDDGPQPTGLRYCMNSAALKLEKQP